ncbi:TRAP transporter large permease [Telmatospirillum sp. J64-1]|uniref:TRAP transporter large permease n=1 Tax=Telmatospirillum sp. J64-1 TaxID=2502183 RepID=UPI00115E15FD|nr:TRAP transporter large permease [Telmatospirillum sp. J64-1]
MSGEIIGLVCIAGMLGLIALRCPVALAMAAMGFLGFGLIVSFEPAISILGSGPFEALSNYSFSPIPLFILMGVFATKARMSSEMFSAARTLFGGWRGGSALAAVTSCGLFSAISGSSLATAASMSRVAMPEMLKNGYSPQLASGALAAGGTLGIIIPPSIALLLYALITEQSVGDMFMAGLIPGILGLALYCAAIAVQVWLKPDLASPSEPTSWGQKIRGLAGLGPFAGVFAFIIGGIYWGIFTPTEAAAVGAALTMVIAFARGMSLRDFFASIEETIFTSAMIFFMIIGAEIFGYFLSVSMLSQSLAGFVVDMGLPPFAVLLSVLLLYVLLGCVMDGMAMMLLTVPIVYPLIVQAGFDPVWFGVVTVIAVEMGLITPPVGMNVFVLKAMSPEINIRDMFRGVMPFVMSDVLRLGLLIGFPSLALALI